MQILHIGPFSFVRHNAFTKSQSENRCGNLCSNCGSLHWFVDEICEKLGGKCAICKAFHLLSHYFPHFYTTETINIHPAHF